jgi:predicted GNAT family N-acyltransferase
MFAPIDFATPEFDAAIQLRHRVLRAPLDLVFSTQEIANEHAWLHFGYWVEDELVGYLQMVPLGNNVWKMRQVAVDASVQGRGIGSKLVACTEAAMVPLGCQKISLHARMAAVPFYLRLGYVTEGDEFTEVGIPHLKMSKAF